MMTGGGYAPVTTTETRNIGGVDTTCQVLTCWRDLPQNKDNGIALPGENSVNVIVKVKGMANGATLQPIFSAAMEYNTWEGTCETHNAAEKKTVTGDPVTVSAKPKYNAVIRTVDLYAVKNHFDFDNTGNELAANKGVGEYYGRVIPVGVTIELYNDDSSKGLKGIELPDGNPITFNINVSSVYRTDGGATITTTDADGYQPLLWSYEGHASNGTQLDGRLSGSTVRYAVACAPANKGRVNYMYCVDGGKFQAVQAGSEIQVTISDYKIDTSHFPKETYANDGSGALNTHMGTGVFLYW